MNVSANAPIENLQILPPEDQDVDPSKFYPWYNVLRIPTVPRDTNVKVGVANIYPNKDVDGKTLSSRPYEEESLIFMLVQLKLPSNATVPNRVDIPKRVTSYPSWDEMTEYGRYWFFTSV